MHAGNKKPPYNAGQDAPESVLPRRGGRLAPHMVRTYKRKTERGAYGDETLKAALLALEEQSLKTVSRLYNIPTSTLRRHRDNRVFTRGALALGPKKPALPTTAERTLRDHISNMEKFYMG
ncbi:hypothetical protein LSAT2_023141 [Lamellibrachia satsuma]|nr:hypothetical protein LSAT2_023141 [Lamellibrachia satsuma]